MTTTMIETAPTTGTRPDRESPDSGGQWFWDRHRDTPFGRYLLDREEAFLESMVGKWTLPRKVLEIGCGSGRTTAPLRSLGLHTTGIDLDPQALGILRKQLPGVPALVADGAVLPFVDQSFDCVVAIQCFEFLQLRQFFAETRRVLRPGGLLIFDALNRWSYKWWLKQLSGRRLDLLAANLSWLQVLQAARAAGFALRCARGYGWPPLTRTSASRWAQPAAWIERRIGLEHLWWVSPKVLFALELRVAG